MPEKRNNMWLKLNYVYISILFATNCLILRIIKSQASICKFSIKLFQYRVMIFSGPTWLILSSMQNMLEKSKFILHSFLTVWVWTLLSRIWQRYRRFCKKITKKSMQEKLSIMSITAVKMLFILYSFNHNWCCLACCRLLQNASLIFAMNSCSRWNPILKDTERTPLGLFLPRCNPYHNELCSSDLHTAKARTSIMLVVVHAAA